MRREPTCGPAEMEAYDDVRALGPPRPFRRLRFACRLVVAAASVAVLTVAARERLAAPPEPRSWAELPRAAGILPARAAVPTEAAVPLLAFAAADGDAPARPDPPRWSPATGLRQDALTGGAFDAVDAPFFRVTLIEEAEGGAAPSSLFVTLARRAAELQGLSVLRTGLRGQLETKFGTFETVEATLSGQGARACTGFRSLHLRGVRLDGWLCGLLGQAPDTRDVACLIDRLALAVPAEPAVETASVDAKERHGIGCGNPLGAVNRRADATGSIAASTGDARKIVAQSRQKLRARQ